MVFLCFLIFLDFSLFACLFSTERRSWMDGEVGEIWKEMEEGKL